MIFGCLVFIVSIDVFFSLDNESCLNWKSNVVEIVDFSAQDIRKLFSIEPFTLCQLHSNNSFEYQLVDGTWRTKNISRTVFELKQRSRTDFLVMYFKMFWLFPFEITCSHLYPHEFFKNFGI